jgi:hypothetical protein
MHLADGQGCRTGSALGPLDPRVPAYGERWSLRRRRVVPALCPPRACRFALLIKCKSGLAVLSKKSSPTQAANGALDRLLSSPIHPARAIVP